MDRLFNMLRNFCTTKMKNINVLLSIDKQIFKNFRDANIRTRPVKSNGIWCCCLLPTILILNILIYEVSVKYALLAYLSVGLFSYSLMFTLFLSISCMILRQQVFGGCMASGLLSALLMFCFTNQGLTYCLALMVPSVFMYSFLLRSSILKCPQTFTIGEAMIVTQGITLFTAYIYSSIVASVTKANAELDFINVIIYTVLLTVGLIIAAIFTMKQEDRTILNLGYLLTAASIFVIIVLQSFIGSKWFMTCISFVFMDDTRFRLFTFWMSLVIMSIITLTFRTKMAVKANTVTRKVFHLLASAVFMSGLLADFELMRLASGVGLGLIILVEALRKSGIEPISSALQSAFEVYCDEKDQGTLAMTPIYLYVGLACPIVLVPLRSAAPLELLSGVLAVGIGDSAASIAGQRFGSIRWHGSNRTVEGTVFNILSQLLVVYALQLFELIHVKRALIRTSIAACVTGLVEAKLEQVDNLILPLITLIAFQLTYFLA